MPSCNFTAFVICSDLVPKKDFAGLHTQAHYAQHRRLNSEGISEVPHPWRRERINCERLPISRPSHQRIDRQARDRDVDRIFEIASFPLLRVPVRRTYDAEAIENEILAKLRPDA
jgi:hypothetical protein